MDQPHRTWQVSGLSETASGKDFHKKRLSLGLTRGGTIKANSAGPVGQRAAKRLANSSGVKEYTWVPLHSTANEAQTLPRMALVRRSWPPTKPLNKPPR
jgi:hypothetical protein